MDVYFSTDVSVDGKYTNVTLYIHDASSDKKIGTFSMYRLKESECEKLRKFLKKLKTKDSAIFERNEKNTKMVNLYIELSTDRNSGRKMLTLATQDDTFNNSRDVYFKPEEDNFDEVIEFLAMDDDFKYDYLYAKFEEQEIKRLTKKHPNHALHMSDPEIKDHVYKEWKKSSENPRRED